MIGDVVVREATTEDALAVRRVLDAAVLESAAVADGVARGDAFVAAAADRVVGALVLVPFSTVELPDGLPDELADSSGMHVDAVAVRRRRRGQGIGRALVLAALERERRLTVAFDPGVRPFYDALDFDVATDAVAGDAERLWATRSLTGERRYLDG